MWWHLALVVISVSITFQSSEYQDFIWRKIFEIEKVHQFTNIIIFSERNIQLPLPKYEFKTVINLYIGESRIRETKLRTISDFENTFMILLTNEVKYREYDIIRSQTLGIASFRTLIIEFRGYKDKEERVIEIEYHNIFWSMGFKRSVLIHRINHRNFSVQSMEEINRHIDITERPVNKWFPIDVKFSKYWLRTAELKDDFYGISKLLVNNLISCFFKHDYFRTLNETYGITDYDRIMHLVKRQIFDISPYIYTLNSSSFPFFSYPLEIVQWRLMIPIQQEIPKHLYIFYPFTEDIWVMITAFCFYFGIALKIISILKSIQIDSLLYPLAITMGTSASPINNEHLILRLACLLLFLYGFLLSNFYLSILSSFLTSTIHGRQISSLEDVLHCKIPIAISYEVDFFLNETFEYNFLKKNFVKNFTDGMNHDVPVLVPDLGVDLGSDINMRIGVRIVPMLFLAP